MTRLRLLSLTMPVLGVMAVVACSVDAVEPVEPTFIELVREARDEPGILTPHSIEVRAVDSGGNPIPGVEIIWTVQAGGGSVVPEDTELTDSAGRASGRWRLGPVVGEQRLRVESPKADPLEVTATAHAGAVLVGLWEDAAEAAPSDTMRLHATEAVYLAEFQAALADGEEWWIAAKLKAGAGVDTLWIFQSIPAGVAPSQGTFSLGLCIRHPPLTEEELEAMLASSGWGSLCPQALRLVGIEEVPDWYIDRLAGG